MRVSTRSSRALVDDRVDRLHLACRRREEHLGDRRQLAHRKVGLARLDAATRRELEQQAAGHAEQATGRRGRRDRDAVAHDEHVGAGRLAEIARRVGEQRLVGTASCAYASARTLAAYEIVFRPAVAERSLRVHGATATRVVAGPGSNGTATMNALGIAPARLDPGGPSPPVTVTRRRASVEPVGLEHRVGRGAQPIGVGEREAETGGRVREARDVAAPRERRSAVHAQRLEHAVADDEAAIERRDPRVAEVEELAVDPDDHGRRGRRRRRTRRARTGRRAGARLELGLGPLGRGVGVGDDRAADTEVGVGVRDRERADRDRELGGARVDVDPADRAAVDAAAHRFEVFDRLHHARLGRAGDRRGRERRVHEVGEAGARAQPAFDRAHEVVQARVRLERGELERAHRTGHAHAAEVVAREVDDHHVLGAVLVAAEQRGRGRRWCP